MRWHYAEAAGRAGAAAGYRERCAHIRSAFIDAFVDADGQAGAGPEAVAGYPGALGGHEAAFTVGSGSHEFAGPALTGNFS